ncbi:MAG: 30S ribosomal protein S12 methylthiotransferase RimO [Bacillota bacterium]
MAKTHKTTIGMVSLGCDKNRVDAEKVLYKLQESGFQLVQDASEAEIIVINTCAFIDSAKEESIDAIFEYAEQKRVGKCKKLVVMGCFAERYAQEVKDSMPEVDLFVGINSYEKIAELVDDKEGVVIMPENADFMEGRVLTTPAHYAYLKISEGCNNFCTYCAIPFIRGRFRSYKMEDILNEAKQLVDNGVKEIMLVGQDTTRYGQDLYGKFMLKELIKELLKLDVARIRLLYMYPELVDDEIIELINSEERICNYIDIPLQHIDNEVLKRMNRRSREGQIRDLLARLKASNSDIAIRSSFIVGFPGETEKEFENLKEFISSGIIDYAGFFAYSQEEGTAAAKMDNQIEDSVKKSREEMLSAIQSEVIVANHKKYVGKNVKVIYEGIDYDKQMFYGRSEQNAPDIDTLVYFTSDFPVNVGNIYDIKIAKTDFNLYGAAIK